MLLVYISGMISDKLHTFIIILHFFMFCKCFIENLQIVFILYTKKLSVAIIVTDIEICAFSLRKNHICKFLLAFMSNF